MMRWLVPQVREGLCYDLFVIAAVARRAGQRQDGDHGVQKLAGKRVHVLFLHQANQGNEEFSEANPAGLDWSQESGGANSRPPAPARANPSLIQPWTLALPVLRCLPASGESDRRRAWQ